MDAPPKSQFASSSSKFSVLSSHFIIPFMTAISFTVNGRAQSIDTDPATPLLYLLSDDLGLRGPKFGCGLGQCGACTVLARGRAVRSCVTPVGTMSGAEI